MICLHSFEEYDSNGRGISLFYCTRCGEVQANLTPTPEESKESLQRQEGILREKISHI